jgi:hypothetical protein
MAALRAALFALYMIGIGDKRVDPFAELLRMS